MQGITDFWKTTTGKLVTIGCGGIAGLLSLCFFCTICGVLIRSTNDTTQEIVARPTRTPRISSPTEVPSRLQPIAVPTRLIPTETPTFLPPPTTPVTEVLPTETPIPQVLKPVVTVGENKVDLRSGPGTDYEIVGTLLSGQSSEIVGRTADSSWWQVSAPEGLAWVAASMVTANNVDDSLPVVEAPPAPIPAEPPSMGESTTEPQPIEPVPTELPSTEVCDCSSDHLNCGDFNTHAEAQACYTYCKSIGYGDVHGLDRDEDGTACDPSKWE